MTEPALYEIDPLRDPRWPVLVERHPGASAFHARGWMEALSRTYGFQPAVLTTSGPESPLANGLAFCKVDSWLTGKRLVSLPFSDFAEPLAGDAGELLRLLTGFAAQGAAQRCKYVEVRPVSSLADWGATISERFYHHRLDLRPGSEALFRRFHKDCIQRKVRRAEKEGIVVREEEKDRILDDFYGMVVQTRRRQGLPPQPLFWFRNVQDCGGASVRIHCAYQGERPLAAMLTLRHGTTVCYKYGASDEKHHNLGAMPYLFWHVIQDAIRQGAEVLDLGRSGFENPGLIAFKDRWNAERSTLSYWRVPAQIASTGETNTWVGGLAQSICKALPGGCLKVVGRVLYRHVA